MAFALCCAAAHPAAAQQVRGTVVDSASRLPIPGAVVSALDSAGGVLARTISNERGAYAIAFLPGTHRLRAIRIGFRPRDVRAPEALGVNDRLDIAMSPLPTMLEPARVEAKQCPKRDDSQRALGLWEQARAGLLASLVAREQRPATLVRLGYERTMRGTTDIIDRQAVQVDTAFRTLGSYRAAFRSDDFLVNGFTADSGDTKMFYAPDADVLLDPNFGNGYCFRLAPRNRERPTHVGLAFTAADRKRGRVDVDGVLWIDTLARALRDIEFTYRNVAPAIDRLRPGGLVSFHEMPNGVVFIDRWNLRLVGASPETTLAPGGRLSIVGTHYYVWSGGGEVADGRWPDGTAFHARLGRLSIVAEVADGTPTGRRIRLVGTPYEAVLDSSGRFEPADLLPGPYHVAVVERRLERLYLDTIPTGRAFTVVRDSTVRGSLVLPSLEDWVRSRCAAGGGLPAQPRPAAGAADSARFPPVTMILARVMDPQHRPLSGITWEVAKAVPMPVQWEPLSAGVTGSDGLIQLCTTRVVPGARIAITLQRRGVWLGKLEQDLSAEQLTLVPLIVLP